MSDDLVKRLRSAECAAGCGSMKVCVCASALDAADRIEALEAALLAADELARAALECHPYVEELRCGDDLRAALARHQKATGGGE